MLPKIKVLIEGGQQLYSKYATYQGMFLIQRRNVYHKWELPVLHYKKIMIIHPYPFFVAMTQLFSCIIFINGCICILTGSPG